MKTLKFMMGLIFIIMILPVVGVMAILGGGISGLYYLVFMMFYRLLDFANGQQTKKVLVQNYKG